MTADQPALFTGVTADRLLARLTAAAVVQPGDLLVIGIADDEIDDRDHAMLGSLAAALPAGVTVHVLTGVTGITVAGDAARHAPPPPAKSPGTALDEIRAMNRDALLVRCDDVAYCMQPPGVRCRNRLGKLLPETRPMHPLRINAGRAHRAALNVESGDADG